MLNKLKNSKGFTLIEVVLVLAIAGLILVVVFLAVQGAQRGRRDEERRNGAARLIAAAEQVVAASNGDMTAADTCAEVNVAFTGGGLTCSAQGTAPTAAASGRLEFGPNQECSATDTFQARDRGFAVRFWNETVSAIDCLDTS